MQFNDFRCFNGICYFPHRIVFDIRIVRPWNFGIDFAWCRWRLCTLQMSEQWLTSRDSVQDVYRRYWRQIRYFGFATEKQLDSLWSKFQIQTLRACAVEALSAQKKELLRQHVNILNLTTKAGHSSPKQIPDPDLVRMKLYTRRRKTTMHTHYVINPGTSRKVVRYFH